MPFGLISSWYVIRRTKIEMELTPVFLSTFLRCFSCKGARFRSIFDIWVSSSRPYGTRIASPLLFSRGSVFYHSEKRLFQFLALQPRRFETSGKMSGDVGNQVLRTHHISACSTALCKGRYTYCSWRRAPTIRLLLMDGPGCEETGIFGFLELAPLILTTLSRNI